MYLRPVLEGPVQRIRPASIEIARDPAKEPEQSCNITGQRVLRCYACSSSSMSPDVIPMEPWRRRVPGAQLPVLPLPPRASCGHRQGPHGIRMRPLPKSLGGSVERPKFGTGSPPGAAPCAGEGPAAVPLVSEYGVCFARAGRERGDDSGCLDVRALPPVMAGSSGGKLVRVVSLTGPSGS